MLSLLPAALEDSPWPSSQRKRPTPPSCLRSTSLRAKRLRQELLLLREWEQKQQQEAMGAHEGQADSSDDAFTVEHPQSWPNIYFVEDSWDSTCHTMHGLRGHCGGSSCPVSFISPPEPLLGAALTPLTFTARGQPWSNPNPPVHKPHNLRFPEGHSFPSISGFPSAGLCSGTFPTVQEEVVWEKAGSRSRSCDTSGSANPLQGFALASGTDGASVQQQLGTSQVGDDEAEANLRMEDVEENLPREETSRACGPKVGSKHAHEEEHLGQCLAGMKASMVLPPLPVQYLGMAMQLRLRLLEFFCEASELLGLGVESLYLAGIMLDCCWVEERMHRSSTTRVPIRDDLQLAGLASLLLAYLSAPTTPSSTRNPTAFWRLLQRGSARFSRVTAMLSVNLELLEKKLGVLSDMLSGAAPDGTASRSAIPYGSLLELRGSCSQKEHMVIFVSQLCAVGYSGLPQEVLSAANCCLVTGAVCAGHADSTNRWQGSDQGQHHLAHFELLDDYLCKGLRSNDCGDDDAVNGSSGRVFAEETCNPLVEEFSEPSDFSV